jgi:hypothetical protein
MANAVMQMVTAAIATIREKVGSISLSLILRVFDYSITQVYNSLLKAKGVGQILIA